MRRSRTLVGAVAVAATVLASCASDDGRDVEPPGTTGAPASTGAPGPPRPDATTTEAASPAPTPSATSSAVEVRVVDGRVEGPRRVTVALGEPVMLRVTSDVADEIHVHGYDITDEVEAGGTTTIQFTANIPGVFEDELEGRHLRLVELEVKP